MNYLFKVDDSYFNMDGAMLYVMDGNQKRKLNKLPNAFTFVFMDLMAVEDNELDISKFQMQYEGDIPENAQAYLIDDETNEMVESVEIESDGSFSFQRLNPDRKYSIKFDEELDQGKVKYFAIPDPVIAVPIPELPKPESVLPKPQNQNIELSALDLKWVIYFDFNEFMLKPDQIHYLVDNVVKQLKSDQKLEVTVEGHADNIGSKDVNYRMSKLRISTVVYHLEIREIDETRMELKPFGELKPISDNSTEEGRAKNRRLEIHLKAVSQ
jgi:outer membrane protein OmpA-like peptidoglycan-associated protein